MMQQLIDFLPRTMIDAHVHIYDASFTPTLRGVGTFAEERRDASDYFHFIKRALPMVSCERAVFLPAPEESFGPADNKTRACAMRFMAEELNAHPSSVGAAFVGPQDTMRDIERLLVHERIRGLKCYFYSSPNRWNAFPDEFLPESAWQIAQAYSLFIVLHLGRANALADAGNMDYVETMAKRYPGAKLILAHCGRSFAAWTAVKNVKRLAQYRNIYYDISSINEAVPIYECLQYAGKDHVFWGSDFPVSTVKGRAVSIGERFVWMDEKALLTADAGIKPATVLEENLMAAYLAADMLELTCSEVQALFYTNAENILFK